MTFGFPHVSPSAKQPISDIRQQEILASQSQTKQAQQDLTQKKIERQRKLIVYDTKKSKPVL